MGAPIWCQGGEADRRGAQGRVSQPWRSWHWGCVIHSLGGGLDFSASFASIISGHLWWVCDKIHSSLIADLQLSEWSSFCAPKARILVTSSLGLILSFWKLLSHFIPSCVISIISRWVLGFTCLILLALFFHCLHDSETPSLSGVTFSENPQFLLTSQL